MGAKTRVDQGPVMMVFSCQGGLVRWTNRRDWVDEAAVGRSENLDALAPRGSQVDVVR